MDLKSGKITSKDKIEKDFIELIERTKKLKCIKLVNKLDNPEKVILDAGYSTRLGYDRTSLKTTIKILAENLRNLQINEIFNTSYSQEELNKAKLLIDKNSIKIEEELNYSEVDKETPEFVFLVIVFDAEISLTT